MLSGQVACKVRIIVVLMMVFSLWMTVAAAGMKEDFLEAVKRGDLPAVNHLITKKVNINTKRKDGVSALMPHTKVTRTLPSYSLRRGLKSMRQRIMA